MVIMTTSSVSGRIRAESATPAPASGTVKTAAVATETMPRGAIQPVNS